MFKPFYGKCVGCGNDRLIVVKKGFCKMCNSASKSSNKDIIYVLRTTVKISPRKNSGQAAIFKEIWDERPHVSQISGDFLGDDMNAFFFSHVLGKGAFPAFKLLKENIWLETPAEHMEWENGDRSHPKFDEKRKEYERLKRMYYERQQPAFKRNNK